MTGLVGPTGPTGPNGVFAQAIFAQIVVGPTLVPPPQTVTPGNPIIFNAIGSDDFGIVNGTGNVHPSFTLPNPGLDSAHYLVNYGVSLAASGGIFALTLDGIIMPGSVLTIYGTDNLFSTSVIVATQSGNPNVLEVTAEVVTSLVGTDLITLPVFTGAYISISQLN
jgi:hypothetical protein